jgi:hypothetical protein
VEVGVQILLDEEDEVADGVRIPPDEEELADGVSKGFDEDELVDGVLIPLEELPDTDAVPGPPAPNPPLLIPLTEHHSMYSS